MNGEELRAAIAIIPAGSWAVGVSGGADSIALLSLLHGRSDLQLHVAHLDHQTRANASTTDAEFVRSLARHWNLPHTIAKRSEIEPSLDSLPTNPSARYRAARIALFRLIVEQHGLTGIILAHHADDQAETILQRLLRGSGPSGLGGMRETSRIGSLLVRRPLLRIHRQTLRDFLVERGQAWREDASNSSDAYLRNRLRRVLQSSPDLTLATLKLGGACGGLRDWLRTKTPELAETFDVERLCELPDLLRHEAARRWLIARGVHAEELNPDVIHRLVNMACDAATPSRLDFPGRIRIHRRRGSIAAALHLEPMQTMRINYEPSLCGHHNGKYDTWVLREDHRRLGIEDRDVEYVVAENSRVYAG